VRRAGLVIFGLLGLGLLLAAVLATPPTGDPALVRHPSTASTGSAGVAAAARWLVATGRPARRLVPGDEDPAAGETWLLLAPAAPLGEREVAALLDHAERGGRVVWALGARGEADQPALARRLTARRLAGDRERQVGPLAPHPLFEGLSLRTGGDGVSSDAPGARPVLGDAERAAAVAVPLGRGELLLLAGTDLLDNRHIGEGQALSLWVRLAAHGPLAFDERHLLRAGPVVGAATPMALALGLQLALLVLFLAAAAWPRLGAVRPPPPGTAGRTTSDYLVSLAELYRRAGAEPALAAATWKRLRRTLERQAGIGAALPAEEAARRLQARAPEAVEPLRRGEAALSRGGEGLLLEVARAAADLEAAQRRPARRPSVLGSSHVDPRR
jgi:hypothetical protein